MHAEGVEISAHPDGTILSPSQQAGVAGFAASRGIEHATLRCWGSCKWDHQWMQTAALIRCHDCLPLDFQNLHVDDFMSSDFPGKVSKTSQNTSPCLQKLLKPLWCLCEGHLIQVPSMVCEKL